MPLLKLHDQGGPPTTTVGDIHTCLATHGATAILSEYDEPGARHPR